MPKGGAKVKCHVTDCDRWSNSFGYCNTHYRRLKNTGTTVPSIRSQARAERTAADGTRRCFKCGQRKPYTHEYFPSDKRSAGRLKGTCRACLRAAVKRSGLARTYGITPEHLGDLLEAQKYQCAICGVGISPWSDGAKLATTAHVDHCHATGQVRGLLCHNCNVLIGHAKESATVLRSAIAYLENANAVP